MKKSTSTPEALGFNTERLARIKPLMQAYVDHHGFSGISTLVARRGEIVHAGQVGWQDRESNTPLTADTIYRLYSMTKPVVCVAAMTLFEEGKFQLSDPVAKFLPAFAKLRVMSAGADGAISEADLVRPMLIQHLFTHTSGLTYNFLEDSPVCALYRASNLGANADNSLETMVAGIATLPLAHQPGTKFNYGLSIDVIARLIEVISGQTLQEFLAERIFKPLGMADTAFSVVAEKMTRLATMYGHPDITTHTVSQMVEAWQRGQNGRQDVDATYPANNTTTFARGGHGLFSTAWDYLRFAQMLCNRGQLDGARILAPSTVDFMYLNHLPAAMLPWEIGGVANPGRGFGLGSSVAMDVAASGLPGSIGEHGWGGAAKTNFWVDPVNHIVGVFMTQYMFSMERPDSDLHLLTYQALTED